EARDLSRQLAFAPALISSGVDLLFIHVRSGELDRAEALLDEVSRSVLSAKGWHGWLWELRLFQVLAGLAFAKVDVRVGVEGANKGILHSHRRHRLKYEALGLTTRARARTKLGELPAAIEDAASAVSHARRLGDPSILIDALSIHLQIDGNDALLNEARAS